MCPTSWHSLRVITWFSYIGLKRIPGLLSCSRNEPKLSKCVSLSSELPFSTQKSFEVRQKLTRLCFTLLLMACVWLFWAIFTNLRVLLREVLFDLHTGPGNRFPGLPAG